MLLIECGSLTRDKYKISKVNQSVFDTHYTCITFDSIPSVREVLTYRAGQICERFVKVDR